MISALSSLLNEHHNFEKKSDITLILDISDVLLLMQNIDLSLYDEVSIKTEAGHELYFVSSVINGKNKMLYVESIYDSEGTLKMDDTNVLIIPSHIPNDIKYYAKNECSSKTFIEILDEVRYSDLIEII